MVASYLVRLLTTLVSIHNYTAHSRPYGFTQSLPAQTSAGTTTPHDLVGTGQYYNQPDFVCGSGSIQTLILADHPVYASAAQSNRLLALQTAGYFTILSVVSKGSF